MIVASCKAYIELFHPLLRLRPYPGEEGIGSWECSSHAYADNNDLVQH